ncbi:methyl-accepting chemotaxis protein [Aneurinibacillus soli]|uniref:Methyl-accepting chemotaxis protein McpA n=1 Tax=Aneurinibacillus soli TaxID=1500254 RepID=A0A0U5ARG1_9BACL|nr:methyl-accepting chemotaxis protein [Aneurinibacillus soli]PYE60126.1 methyl-accepting chemotaxis protein [Aneurinibacillus soli]BAU26385.1 Methyl-accepting chemotaxis protein McpA [Aneurinibacillus soli]
MKISQKLLGGFGVILLLLAILVGVSYYEFHNVDQTYSELISKEDEKIILITEANSLVNEQSKAVRGYLLLGDETALQSYEKANSRYQEVSKSLEGLLVTEKGKSLLAEMNKLNDDYGVIAQQLIAYKKQNKVTEYQQLVKTQERDAARKFTEKAQEFKKFVGDYVQTVSNETSIRVQAVKQFLIMLAGVAIIVGTVIAVMINRIISRPIIAITNAAKELGAGNLTIEDVQVKGKDEIGELAVAFNQTKNDLRDLIKKVQSNAEQVAASSEELFASSEQAAQATNHVSSVVEEVASGSETQTRGMDETKRAIEENAIAIQRIAESTSAVSDSAMEVLTESKQGNEIIKRTIKQMEEIQASVKESADVVRTLGENSKEIGNIVETINQIAEQTNLLALNAAIEAARAGEHGKGFAVVADEVRKLAEQSRQSTEQIASLIEGIQQNTAHAVQAMEKGTKDVEAGTAVANDAGEAFQHILFSVEQAVEGMQEVSAATEEISASTQQVTASVEQMADIASGISESMQGVAASSEEQLASAEEITAAAESLSNLAQELQHEVSQFNV